MNENVDPVEIPAILLQDGRPTPMILVIEVTREGGEDWVTMMPTVQGASRWTVDVATMRRVVAAWHRIEA